MHVDSTIDVQANTTDKLMSVRRGQCFRSLEIYAGNNFTKLRRLDTNNTGLLSAKG